MGWERKQQVHRHAQLQARHLEQSCPKVRGSHNASGADVVQGTRSTTTSARQSCQAEPLCKGHAVPPRVRDSLVKLNHCARDTQYGLGPRALLPLLLPHTADH